MTAMRIGVTCFPSFGGSGIVATEIGLGMARRGHQVHFICAEPPRRLDSAAPNVHFHPVDAPGYPVLPHRPYTEALAAKIVEVAEGAGLDLVHSHYAVPHATAGWMAREILGGGLGLVTTLHGTDVTVLGADPACRPMIRHAVRRCDAVLTPSAFLRDAAWRILGLSAAQVPIEVIPNFVDPVVFHPGDDAEGPDPIIVHVSNFRPIKRVPQVVEVFAQIAARTPARLRLIGDGPDRSAVEALVERLGLGDRVELLGKQAVLGPLLRGCALFLLPSRSESFGLAALEALASGVPVIAAAVGGLPEVIRPGETGWLVPPDDLAGMASRAVALLGDPARLAQMRAAARIDAEARFAPSPLLDRVEAVYRRIACAH